MKKTRGLYAPSLNEAQKWIDVIKKVLKERMGVRGLVLRGISK